MGRQLHRCLRLRLRLPLALRHMKLGLCLLQELRHLPSKPSNTSAPLLVCYSASSDAT